MDSVVRSLWLARAWTALSLLGFLWAMAAAERTRLPMGVALLGTAIEALAVLGTASVTRALVRGDRGDILMRNGARVPRGTLRASFLADTAELLVALAATGGLCADLLSRGSPLFPVASLFGVGVLLLQLLMWTPRYWSHQMFEAVWSSTAGQLERAESCLRAVEQSRIQSYQVAAARIRTQLLLRRGQPYSAEQLLERTWNGTLDDHGAMLAWIRLGAQGTALAERWLGVTSRDSHRYSVYLTALVGSTLALYQGRHADAIARVRHVPDGLLPPWYHAQLGLVEVAALQGSGQHPELPAVLARLGPLEPHAWLASVQPALWRLVQEAQGSVPGGAVQVEPRPSPAPPKASDDPFAPPSSPVIAAARPSRFAGAIPVEGLALGQTRSASLAVLRFILGLLLIFLGSTLALLLFLMDRIEPSPPPGLGFEPLVAATIPWLGLGLLVEQLVGFIQPKTGPRLVLSDGREVSAARFTLWAVAATLPQLGGALFTLMAPLFLVNASQLGSPSWGAILLFPLALLLLWTVFLRIQSLRLVGRLHFDPPEQVLRRVTLVARPWLRHSGQASVGVALAGLWSGDRDAAERAERDLEELAAAQALPQVTQVLGWFHAARGRLDLDRALREPEPDTLGERYRWAVTLCLAALHAGRPELLRDRTVAYDALAAQLPNRFGGLLRHLSKRIRGEGGPTDPDLGWIAAVWPFAA